MSDAPDSVRHWKDWPGLLKWSLQYQDGTQPSQFQEMDEERKRWLAEALKAMAQSEVDVMVAKLKVIVDKADGYFEGTFTAEEVVEREAALLDIRDLVDNMDNARDLIPLGGFEPILGLLRCKYASIRKAAADVIAVAVQNHPETQRFVLSKGSLPSLLLSLRDSEEAEESVSLLNTLSSLIRGDSPAFPVFMQLNGLADLLSTLSTQKENLRYLSKFFFLLCSLTRDHAEIIPAVANESLLRLLHENIESEKREWIFRELCLELLASLSSHPSPSHGDLYRPFMPTLMNVRKQFSSSPPETQDSFREVLEYLNQITRNILSPPSSS
jgi:hypothetical protein